MEVYMALHTRLVLTVLLAVTPSLAQVTAIRAGAIIDPSNGKLIRNQIILVEGTKITSVGADTAIPSGANVIDLSKSYVLPGLMDAHTHISWNSGWGDEGTYARLETTSTAFRALMAIKLAREALNAGFTTLRDVGGIEGEYAMTDVRHALSLGWFIGPTIQSCGKIIGPYGGQYHHVAPEYGRTWTHDFADADSPEEVRAAVRRNIFYGANCIKLVADNSVYHYSVEEVKAAVDEAHSAGLAVAVHVLGGEAARNVILGGADSIEHGHNLDDDLLRLMKEHGTFLSGTEFPLAHLVGMYRSQSEAEAQDRKEVDRLRRSYKVGVKIVFSTDTVIDLPGKTRGQMMLDYLDQWVRAGIPAADTLKAMITTNAELLRIADQRGRIAPGYVADIIATPQNPLDDIKALREANFVMKDGRQIKQQAAGAE
jgi:imidazolonepropionase-like amidohydrolase